MYQTIKKLIIEPLIYPFYRENYKKTLLGGLIILSLWVLTLFPNILCYIFFGGTVGIFILGYCLTVFIYTLKNIDTLPTLKNKEIFTNGFKIFVVILFLSVSSLLICLFLVDSYILKFLIWIHVLLSLTLLIFVCLLFPYPISTETLLYIQNYDVRLFIILAIFYYFFPLILFKLYNKKIKIKNLLRVLDSPKYVLIVGLSLIYLIFILKVAIYLMFLKSFIVFYFLIVIARMFGVYFKVTYF
ncbi:hypothetical protein ACO3VM_01495 [Methanocaldococcus sp. 10A]